WRVSEKIEPGDKWADLRLDWDRDYRLKHKKHDGHCSEKLTISIKGPSSDEIAVTEVLGNTLSEAECRRLAPNKGAGYPLNTCFARYNREKFGPFHPERTTTPVIGKAPEPIYRVDKAPPELQCWKLHEAVEEIYMKGHDPRDLFGAPIPALTHFLRFRSADVADKQIANKVQLGHNIGAAHRCRAASALGTAIQGPDTSDTGHPGTVGFPAISTNDIDESVGQVFQRPRAVPTASQLDRTTAALSFNDLSRQVLHSCNSH
ncbi:unnamed protein product, partial [Prorocentrum cordatum]